MTDRENVISHLKIIRTWNEVGKAYALDESDKKEKARTVEWIDDALNLLKEQESVIETLKSDLSETLQVLSEQPEIVRCADCTFRNEINCPQYYRRSELPDDWFCGDGERKNDG